MPSVAGHLIPWSHMALTPEEQAQLALLTAKAVEPEPSSDTTVVVSVEQPAAHQEPDGDEQPAAPVESQADIIVAEAVAQTIVIDAQAEADMRREAHAAELRRQEEERWHGQAVEAAEAAAELDPETILDSVMGPIEEAVSDTAPAPSHWFFRKWGHK